MHAAAQAVHRRMHHQQGFAPGSHRLGQIPGAASYGLQPNLLRRGRALAATKSPSPPEVMNQVDEIGGYVQQGPAFPTSPQRKLESHQELWPRLQEEVTRRRSRGASSLPEPPPAAVDGVQLVLYPPEDPPAAFPTDEDEQQRETALQSWLDTVQELLTSEREPQQQSLQQGHPQQPTKGKRKHSRPETEAAQDRPRRSKQQPQTTGHQTAPKRNHIRGREQLSPARAATSPTQPQHLTHLLTTAPSLAALQSIIHNSRTVHMSSIHLAALLNRISVLADEAQPGMFDQEAAQQLVSHVIHTWPQSVLEADAAPAVNILWGAASTRNWLDQSVLQSLMQRVVGTATTEAAQVTSALESRQGHVTRGRPSRAATHSSSSSPGSERPAEPNHLQLTPQRLSRAVWSAGKLCPDLLAQHLPALTDHLITCLPHMNTVQLVSVVWGLSRSKVQPSPWLSEAITQELWSRGTSVFRARELFTLLTALLHWQQQEDNKQPIAAGVQQAFASRLVTAQLAGPNQGRAGLVAQRAVWLLAAYAKKPEEATLQLHRKLMSMVCAGVHQLTWPELGAAMSALARLKTHISLATQPPAAPWYTARRTHHHTAAHDSEARSSPHHSAEAEAGGQEAMRVWQDTSQALQTRFYELLEELRAPTSDPTRMPKSGAGSSAAGGAKVVGGSRPGPSTEALALALVAAADLSIHLTPEMKVVVTETVAGIAAQAAAGQLSVNLVSLVLSGCAALRVMLPEDTVLTLLDSTMTDMQHSLAPQPDGRAAASPSATADQQQQADKRHLQHLRGAAAATRQVLSAGRLCAALVQLKTAPSLPWLTRFRSHVEHLVSTLDMAAMMIRTQRSSPARSTSAGRLPSVPGVTHTTSVAAREMAAALMWGLPAAHPSRLSWSPQTAMALVQLAATGCITPAASSQAAHPEEHSAEPDFRSIQQQQQQQQGQALQVAPGLNPRHMVWLLQGIAHHRLRPVCSWSQAVLPQMQSVSQLINMGPAKTAAALNALATALGSPVRSSGLSAVKARLPAVHRAPARMHERPGKAVLLKQRLNGRFKMSKLAQKSGQWPVKLASQRQSSTLGALYGTPTRLLPPRMIRSLPSATRQLLRECTSVDVPARILLGMLRLGVTPGPQWTQTLKEVVRRQLQPPEHEQAASLTTQGANGAAAATAPVKPDTFAGSGLPSRPASRVSLYDLKHLAHALALLKAQATQEWRSMSTARAAASEAEAGQAVGGQRRWAEREALGGAGAAGAATAADQLHPQVLPAPGPVSELLFTASEAAAGAGAKPGYPQLVRPVVRRRDGSHARVGTSGGSTQALGQSGRVRRKKASLAKVVTLCRQLGLSISTYAYATGMLKRQAVQLKAGETVQGGDSRFLALTLIVLTRY